VVAPIRDPHAELAQVELAQVEQGRRQPRRRATDPAAPAGFAESFAAAEPFVAGVRDRLPFRAWTLLDTVRLRRVVVDLAR
jgi:hypothetical protein